MQPRTREAHSATPHTNRPGTAGACALRSPGTLWRSATDDPCDGVNVPLELEYFFSFRSTYAFLSFHRLKRALPELDVSLTPYAVFPPPEGPEPQVSADPRHFAYMLHDFARHCEAYGLAMKPPLAKDTDWMPSHAAFYFAQEKGKGLAYLEAGYACRFQRQLDLGRDEVLRDIATEVGLDPEALVRAAHSDTQREQVRAGMQRFFDQGMVGVPGFVVGEQRFWGNDRLEWVIRAIFEAQGRTVPDLARDPLAHPAPLKDR